MTRTNSNRKGIIIITILLLFILASTAIYTYTRYLQKATADLIEVVPNDAAFIFQINDNEDFVKSITHCRTQINDIFSLEALSGIEYFTDLSKTAMEKKKNLIISGHQNENGISLLFAVHMQPGNFNHIIKTLQINPKNYTEHAGYKIYNAATHYSEFKITLYKEIFIAAENQKLIEAAIDCIASSKCLAHQPDFSPIQNIITKNTKQNWLILNHSRFINTHIGKIEETWHEDLQKLCQLSEWSCYQIRFENNQMMMSGYLIDKEQKFFKHFANIDSPSPIPDHLLPSTLSYFVTCIVPKPLKYPLAAPIDSLELEPSQLNLHNSCRFMIHNDSLTYHYLLIPADSLQASIKDLLTTDPSTAATVTHKKHIIYRCQYPDFISTIPGIIYPFETHYFTQYKGYYIFADTLLSLQYYLNQMIENKTINESQYYQFTQSMMPKNNSIAFYYQNRNNDFNRFLTKKYKRKPNHPLSIKVFAFTFSQPIGEIIPNNLYIRFSE